MAAVLILLAGVALLLYSAKQDVLLGQIAVPILTLGALHGVLRGGLRKIVTLGVSVGVLYGVTAYPGFADPAVKAITGSSGGLTSGIVSVVIVVLALLLASVFVNRLHRRLIVGRRFVQAADRLMGTGIGLAEGAFVALAACWISVMIQPHAALVRDHPSTVPGSVRHRIAAGLLRLADEARTEPLGGFVDATNLLEKTPAVREAFEELNTSGRFSFRGLDAETAARLSKLMPQLMGDEAGDPEQWFQEYRQGNASRDRAYQQLPPPQQGGR